MRTLIRNKKPFYYALYSDKTAVLDANGDKTGTYAIGYGNVVLKKGNISSNKGTADTEAFGISVKYSRTIALDGACPFDESTALWVDLGEIAEYSATKSYAIGAKTIYNGKIYKAKANATGAWDSSKWDAIPHNYEVKAIANSLNSSLVAIDEIETK